MTTTSFGLLLVSRALTGAVAGLYDATAFAVAIASVPPERAGRAIAVVISGVPVSAAFGVPLGTVVGNLLGWRGSFVAVIVLAGAVLAAARTLVPSVPAEEGSAADQARHAFAPRVLAVLGLCFLVFASTYAALTYIVPFLAEVTGVGGAPAGGFLLAYGAATAIGSFGGGRFADQNAAGTLVVGTAGCAVTLPALYFLGASAVVVVVVMLAWGVCVFGMAPSLQYRVVSLAGPGGGARTVVAGLRDQCRDRVRLVRGRRRDRPLLDPGRDPHRSGDRHGGRHGRRRHPPPHPGPGRGAHGAPRPPEHEGGGHRGSYGSVAGRADDPGRGGRRTAGRGTSPEIISPGKPQW
ncbi:hypothetical protein GCM10010252_27090 [Streptomyces aureoverticillatus]|nr:hypothetical protein GCM10010252_27090 [Streptomyces aureoverticillatus]